MRQTVESANAAGAAGAGRRADAVEDNLALGRRFFAEQDRLRGGPAEALCAATYQAILGSNPPIDRAGHEAFARGFYAAFPDVGHDLEEVLATEDRVAVRFVLRGTHTGSFFGIPRPVAPSAWPPT